VQAVDSKNGSSPLLSVSMNVCPNCSGNGACNKNIIQSSKSNADFVVYACQCFPAYTGDNCYQNYNACSDNPCAKGQNCTDMTPEEQGNQTIGYTCGPCPAGLEKRNISGTFVCYDIDECQNATICEQKCINTEGSYYCGCSDGYRLNTDSKTCADINECAEMTAKCEQQCTNKPGSFECVCYAGFNMINKECQLDATDKEKCNKTGCHQLCEVVNGLPSCLCKSGYTLKSDNKSCENINECKESRRFCSQICTDTDGSFYCSCSAGYKLASDQTSCIACDPPYWGINCANMCQCSGQGTCSSVSGCVCDKGWEGTNCNKDIDECKQKPDVCPALEICENKSPGFECLCPGGYERKNGTCTDINECENIILNNCDVNKENCYNYNGNYTCNCKDGLSRNSIGQCQDIDECKLGTHKCQHTCTNTEGSYNCRCFYGFTLSDNRLDCVQDKPVCVGLISTNCSQGCTLDDVTNAAKCFCYAGYELQSDNKTCSDIDECNSTAASCSSNAQCINDAPGFHCSCPEGTRLGNDGRTCIDCLQGTWGLDCARNCSCSLGASTCNPKTGCVCKDGYNGTYCTENINQCGQLNCSQYKNQECVERYGPDLCACKPGFANSTATGQCENINECALLSNCSQKCTDTEGSYYCSCLTGFNLTTDSYKCEDIDECKMNLSNCKGDCINTAGYFTCSCSNGFQLSADGFSCEDINECSLKMCPQNCINTVGSYNCTCFSGYQLDNGTCQDINECSLKICHQDCINTVGSYNCTCFSGYQLVNGTCQDINECSLKMCPQDCINTVGSYNCTCFSGYQLVNGTCQDINECSLKICHQDCINTVGSYNCTCFSGYQLVNGTCQDINECSLKMCPQDCINTVGSYNCTCFSGYQLVNGTCQDIDECSRKLHNCSQNCTNVDGGFKCSCSADYVFDDKSGTCQKVMNKSLSIKFEFDAAAANVTLDDKNHESYISLKGRLETSMSALLRVKIEGFVSLQITDMRNGSLIVDYIMITVEEPREKYINTMANTLIYLANNFNLTWGNQTLKIINWTIEKKTFTSSDSACSVFTSFFNCTCQMSNGNAVCMPETNSSNDRLTLGLAIGIPLFVVFAACIVVGLLIWKKRRVTGFKKSVYSFEDDNARVFTRSFVKKGSWGQSDLFQHPYDAISSSSGSSENSRASSKDAETKDIDQGNFSWDFIYKTLEPEKEFKIKRPILTPGFITRL
ncbi:hypothetical protein Btru_048687, partial [Bulinus truncatus]